MPQRARDRTNLNSGHPVQHVRDDRAIEVGRQKIEHRKDRRKSKHHRDMWDILPRPGYHPENEFRRHRGGRELRLGAGDMQTFDTDSRMGDFGSELDFRSEIVNPSVNLWDMAKPTKRRDRRLGFEMVNRPLPVVVLDDSEDEEDDYEFVERMPAVTKKSGKAKKTFSQAVQRKTRFR